MAEIITCFAEPLRLDDMALGVFEEAQPFHENQLSIGYQVVAYISMIGRIYK